MSRFAEDRKWDEASYAAGMIDHELKIAQFETVFSLSNDLATKVTVGKKGTADGFRPEASRIFFGENRL